MKNLSRSIAAMFILVGLAGCTSMHMFNNPTAEMSILQQAQIPANVGLYVTPKKWGQVYG